ncbi:Tc5 transposase DNA-binding domain [Phytophthora infestans]|uniref:Tc5 transposase DNA-binding domain n=1 Tax=Phytophthora infestans TaxID=4787 RepID=A0A833WWG7_PHYIN|nr:Tc5 transposase DNA-binding domain [Phytophthora infestans]
MADTTPKRNEDDVHAVPNNDAEALAPPQPGTKRKKLSRTALTLREKAIVKSFCEQKVTDCKARGDLVPSQGVLRREVAAQFGWSCGRSTLSKIIAMDWKLLRGSHEGGEAPRNPNMKRRRRPLFPAFEADLVKFITAHVSEEDSNKDASGFLEQSQSEIAGSGNTGSVAEEKGTPSSAIRRRPLTEALILEEAQRLKQVHGVSDEMLVLSVGWLARFKHRHCIRLRKPSGKSTMPLHQQVGSSESISMGAWSAGFIPTSLPQTQVVTEPSISRQSGVDSAVGGDEHLLPPSIQQVVNLQLASGSESSVAVTRAAVCSAQWHHTKRSSASALLEQIPRSIRELVCTCQQYDDFIGAIGGLRVAVVGLGSFVDAFVLSQAVGASGSVTCVEASTSNIYAAERIAESFCLSTLGLPTVNMTFIMGEYSGMPQSSSAGFPASKNAVLELAFSLLKVGGELRATDLVCSRRLSSSECEEARLAMAVSGESSKQLQQKLLLGAPYVGDLKRLIRTLGTDVDVRTESCITAAIDNAVASILPPLATATDVRFYPATFHVFRIQDVEEPREDYGQTAIFNGSDGDDKSVVGGALSRSFRLDDEWNFDKGVRMLVDGNTAQILQTTWMRRYFSVSGDRSRHAGPFARAHVVSSDSGNASGHAMMVDQSAVVVASPSTEPLEIANI